MRKFSLAIGVFAAMLAIAPPSASCDSFGYKISGSKIGANSSFDAGHGGVPGRISESGIFASTGLPGTDEASAFGLPGSQAVERPITGAYFFDNFFERENKGINSQDNTGALIDLNGQGLVLLSGSYRGGAAGKNGKFVFADRGTYRVSNELQRGRGLVRSDTTALTVTPEPGSLFLLGTGLLGLALVLFWKAARRSTGS